MKVLVTITPKDLSINGVGQKDNLQQDYQSQEQIENQEELISLKDKLQRKLLRIQILNDPELRQKLVKMSSHDKQIYIKPFVQNHAILHFDSLYTVGSLEKHFQKSICQCKHNNDKQQQNVLELKKSTNIKTSKINYSQLSIINEQQEYKEKELLGSLKLKNLKQFNPSFSQCQQSCTTACSIRLDTNEDELMVDDNIPEEIQEKSDIQISYFGKNQQKYSLIQQK